MHDHFAAGAQSCGAAKGSEGVAGPIVGLHVSTPAHAGDRVVAKCIELDAAAAATLLLDVAARARREKREA